MTNRANRFAEAATAAQTTITGHFSIYRCCFTL